MSQYQDLIVWQKSMDLVVSVYGITGKLPEYEKYALADQIRRAVVSIPSNIAEGQKRATHKEAAQFMSIALGSTAEVETQLMIINRLYSHDVQSELNLCAEINRMLIAIIKKFRGV